MNILSWIFDAKIRALVSARCNGNTVTGRGTGNDTLPQRDGAGGKITFHKTDFYIRSVAGTAYAELGGDFVESGGKTWFRKNGDDVFEIKNEKILPNKKSNYHQGADGTPIGDPANGYQVVKVGDDIKVKRVPDEAPYQSGDYLTKLKEHPNAHTLDRHGHDVTDDALLKRANEGIAPDGSTIGNFPPYTLPPYSSKFDSPDALKEAYDNTKPGSTAFNNTAESPVGTKKVLHTKSSGNYGKGVAAGQSTFQNTNLVRATYVKNANGDWQLITMFPDF